MAAPLDADPPPRTAQQFMELLARSRLLADSVFLRLMPVFERRRWISARELAQKLINDKVLTHWHGTQLLSGEWRFYFEQFKLLEKLENGESSLVEFIVEDLESQQPVRLALQSGLPHTILQRSTLQWWRQARHRFLVAAVKVSEHTAGLLVCTDYESGPTLPQWIERFGMPKFAVAARWISQLCELVADTAPPELQRELSLTEFHIGGQGQLRWAGLQPELHFQHTVEPSKSITWPQQIARLLVKRLLPKTRRSVETTEQLAELDCSSWPEEGVAALHLLLETGDLAQAAEDFRALSSLPQLSEDIVPLHLRRSQLLEHIRRSPPLPARLLPQCSLKPQPTAEPALGDLLETIEAEIAASGSPAPPVRKQFVRLKQLVTPLLLALVAGLLWITMWLQGSANPLEATESVPPSSTTKDDSL